MSTTELSPTYATPETTNPYWIEQANSEQLTPVHELAVLGITRVVLAIMPNRFMSWEQDNV